MASRRAFERITFRDTRGEVARARAVHLRDITWTTQRERRVRTAAAAASVWHGCGPVTVDHATSVVFAGAAHARVGDFTTRLITREEAEL